MNETTDIITIPNTVAGISLFIFSAIYLFSLFIMFPIYVYVYRYNDKNDKMVRFLSLWYLSGMGG